MSFQRNFNSSFNPNVNPNELAIASSLLEAALNTAKQINQQATGSSHQPNPMVNTQHRSQNTRQMSHERPDFSQNRNRQVQLNHASGNSGIVAPWASKSGQIFPLLPEFDSNSRGSQCQPPKHQRQSLSSRLGPKIDDFSESSPLRRQAPKRPRSIGNLKPQIATKIPAKSAPVKPIIAKKEFDYTNILPSLLECTICEKKAPQPERFSNHISGRFHKEMMEVLAEEDARFIKLFQHHCYMVEMRKRLSNESMASIRASRASTTGPNPDRFCHMCDVEFDIPIPVHRKREQHTKLKSFIHPNCEHCKKEFQTRTDWDIHRFSPEHLRSLQKEGISRPVVEPRYFEMFQNPEKSQLEKSAEMESNVLKDDKVNSYKIPKFEDGKIVGSTFLKDVNGHFCKLCKKLVLTEAENHCKSQEHYNKFAAFVEGKKSAAQSATAKSTPAKPTAENVASSSAAQSTSSKGHVTQQAVNQNCLKTDEQDDSGNWKRNKLTSAD